MSASLNEQYEEKVRPCIDLIDSLRALGVEKDLALPAIAVIGDQSSGKSSVLEALSGVALPRGNGMVTRCPLELKMVKSKNKDMWHGKIRYKSHEQNIKNPKDVDKFIIEAQENIVGAKGISDELISLEVTSADVPDLTLIDLPGIVRVSVKGQPEDIGEQSKKLSQRFIEKQGTIILVVVPCNVDIATTEALKMAQEVDPKGERTLGILTKPDLVDKGTEDVVVSIINNEIIYLNKGYMIVKCRGQQDIDNSVPLYESVAIERDFFKNHPQFSILYEEGKATISNLAKKLTVELVSHIVHSLPQMEEQIHKRLAEIQAELDRYGSEPPTEPDQIIRFLNEKIEVFTKDASKLAAGEELRNMTHVNIFSSLREHFAAWKKILDDSAGKFDESIIKELEEYEKKYRGRELPGFLDFKTFEIILRKQLKKLEEPAIRKLKEISDLFNKELMRLAQYSFPGFPNLSIMAKTKIKQVQQAKESEAESLLKTQFMMELMIYTEDSKYKDTLRIQKFKEEEEEREKFGVACPASHSLYDYLDDESCFEELTRHLKSYYRISTMRLTDQVPLVIRYMMVQETAAQLQREMILIQDKDNLNALVKEEHDIASKRNNLKTRQKRLTEALNYMADFQSQA
ncbi:Interferon-induced GTP-binding protein Mx1 [Bagarius yarrelli]|uniref:Interferon-induced GTP-binding protein Mx1 n=1 Tax=Bagarius yarrelli TaxID=175774 RepID=A0A556TK77_BAGYA|nr:Interferon-induced GTP-binding protein Mx1 [Bagarius yarrelli]